MEGASAASELSSLWLGRPRISLLPVQRQSKPASLKLFPSVVVSLSELRLLSSPCRDDHVHLTSETVEMRGANHNGDSSLATHATAQSKPPQHRRVEHRPPAHTQTYS